MLMMVLDVVAVVILFCLAVICILYTGVACVLAHKAWKELKR